MTAPDYARLRELASAATAEHDARYLADCDPQAILALLDERDALLAEVAELETDCQRHFVQISDDGERIAVLTAERDQLAVVLDRVRAELAQHREHASCVRRRRLKLDAEDLEAVCDAIEAILPREAP